METGDIYVWSDDRGAYVKEENEPEVVTEYVAVETDSNDDQLSDVQTSISDLEGQVSDLEDQVMLLENEIELLSSYDAAGDYNLGTTNVAIFEGLVAKVPIGDHYVYWRDGQYSYKFAYGDLSLVGTTFSANGDITLISYDTVGSSYNSYYTYDVSTDSNFRLSASNKLVYSDLGSYPGLGVKEVIQYGAITAYTVVCFAIFLLLDRLRSSCFGRSSR